MFLLSSLYTFCLVLHSPITSTHSTDRGFLLAFHHSSSRNLHDSRTGGTRRSQMTVLVHIKQEVVVTVQRVLFVGRSQPLLQRMQQTTTAAIAAPTTTTA